MTHLKTLFIAAPVALGLLAAPAAHAEWRGHDGGAGMAATAIAAMGFRWSVRFWVVP